MTGTMLYLRSRSLPSAVAVAAGGTALLSIVWTLVFQQRATAGTTVALTVQLMVAVFSATLSGPDGDLDRTASLRWPWRRAAHLIVLLALVVLIMAVTLAPDFPVAPAVMAVRDAAGLLGLTALCACVVGAARSWFLPLGWTVAAISYTRPHAGGALATWQAQPYDSRSAAVLAVVLAATGLGAYALAGPPPGPRT